MTAQRRYGTQLDHRHDARVREPAPCTLPVQAYGPEPLTTTADRPRVWVWVQWRDRPAERVPGAVLACNDRVVVVEVAGAEGSWQPVVWRQAVSRRGS